MLYKNLHWSTIVPSLTPVWRALIGDINVSQGILLDVEPCASHSTLYNLISRVQAVMFDPCHIRFFR
jgi:hypothetical protein